ncbi:FAD-dependent monooxygenase [Mycolicibacterium sp. S2-37]|uniref:FAD-dependent oxidoreductase n=1 Tax=Mycolicibacterium sp. S2-37 TaxID=2810297 RepID=UPI001A93CD7D|nr:FAD-dependent monooxygenase [Mycolicibacterium sp. S2-37]MBO0681491.1 FAD-dependent monooxygenase [Mycolicibacterium sp. S2-37]
MARTGHHALVIGASMAGLLAARVLTEHYDRVTVVERDTLDGAIGPRRGVPQGCQPHVLLARCAQIVDELFPGYLDELVAAGAHRWNDGELSSFDTCFAGHVMRREGRIPMPESLIQHYASRPLIEHQVRGRLLRLPGVTLLDGHHVGTLLSSGSMVTGAAVRGPDGGVRGVPADLVIDASGRGSRAPVFLEELGFSRPPIDELTVRVTYASMPVRMPPEALRQNFIVRAFEPGRPRGFFMTRCEKDTWVVGVGTLGGVRPPTSPVELLDFAADFAPPYAVAAARAAEPLAAVSVHQYPSNRWRRYDQLSRVPDGFVVMGDAMCSFNPIYGQGMTIAAIEAVILGDCLRRGEKDLPKRFYRAAVKPVRLAWQTAVGSDLALPEVAGRATPSMRLTNAYSNWVLRAAGVDPMVTQDFMRVLGMVAPPSLLMQPSFMLRVARANRTRRQPVVTAPARAAV